MSTQVSIHTKSLPTVGVINFQATEERGAFVTLQMNSEDTTVKWFLRTEQEILELIVALGDASMAARRVTE